VARDRGRGDAGGDDGCGLLHGSGVPEPEESSQQTVALLAIRRTAAAAARSRSKRLVLRVLVCVLLAVVHLLLERLRLLLISKRERGQTILELEGVEEDAVLVVAKGVV